VWWEVWEWSVRIHRRSKIKFLLSYTSISIMKLIQLTITLNEFVLLPIKRSDVLAETGSVSARLKVVDAESPSILRIL
jgi:hypothetical protein